MGPVLSYELVGARGGQGTTTVATALAVLAAGHGPTVLAATRPDDVMALAGARPGRPPTRLAPNLDLVAAGDACPPAAEVGVADLGHLGAAGDRPAATANTRRWLVMRGPCYLGLRTALESGAGGADGVVLLTEPGRSLDAGDVEAVLGVPVVVDIPIDAGRRPQRGRRDPHVAAASARRLPATGRRPRRRPGRRRAGRAAAAGGGARPPPRRARPVARPAPAPPAVAGKPTTTRRTEEAMTADPYLRPASPEGAPAPCPPGHTAEPAGTWGGRSMEVVYDPRRNDVAFVLGETSSVVRHGLVATGFRHQDSDGDNQLWVRDRMALARERLERTTVRLGPPRIA